MRSSGALILYGMSRDQCVAPRRASHDPMSKPARGGRRLADRRSASWRRPTPSRPTCGTDQPNGEPLRSRVPWLTQTSQIHSSSPLTASTSHSRRMRASANVPVWESVDLEHWTDLGDAAPELPSWATKRGHDLGSVGRLPRRPVRHVPDRGRQPIRSPMHPDRDEPGGRRAVPLPQDASVAVLRTRIDRCQPVRRPVQSGVARMEGRAVRVGARSHRRGAARLLRARDHGK